MPESDATVDYGPTVDDGVPVTSSSNKPTLPSSSALTTHADKHHVSRKKAAVIGHWRLHSACCHMMDRAWRQFHATLSGPPEGVYERDRESLIDEVIL